MSWCSRLWSVRRRPQNPVVSETVGRICAKFGGKVTIHHISRKLSGILKIFSFRIDTFLTQDPRRVKSSQRYSSYDSLQPIFFLSVPCDNPYKSCLLEIRNLKTHTAEFSLKMGPCGIKISKRYFYSFYKF